MLPGSIDSPAKIDSLEDWVWYLKLLDAQKRVEHVNDAVPFEFPVWVISTYEPDEEEGLQHAYTHWFSYQIKKTCTCGAEVTVDPFPFE